MSRNRKVTVITSVCLALVFIACFSIYMINQNSKQELRSKYPLIKESQYLIDDADLSFEERILTAPHIAEIEIVKQLPDYTVLVEDEAVGISAQTEFCQFQVKLISDISDTDIVTEEDGTFVIAFPKELESSYPVLQSGTVAICSIEAASGVHRGKYLFYDRTFYYIDGNTALAAYEGDDSPAGNLCTENKLVNQIRSIRNS